MRKVLFIFLVPVLFTFIPGFSAFAEDVNSHALDTFYEEFTKEKIMEADTNTVLRRMSLHLRGNIPLLSEILEFEKISPEYRTKKFAVDFLRDPDFANYWGIYFASLMREQTTAIKYKYASFYKYLSESLHYNKPYHILTTEILTATGDSESNPASGFYLRDSANYLLIADYTSRIFYAKNISCARCHDHPTETFTRQNFYEFASFFSQQFITPGIWDLKYLQGKAVPWTDIDRIREPEKTEIYKQHNEWINKTWNKMNNSEKEVWKKKHELIYLKIIYNKDLIIKGPDPTKKSNFEPRFLDGAYARLTPDEDKRKVLANWLTERSNQRFRYVIINRIWKKLMGWAFFEPLDDWNSKTKFTGEKILEHLDSVFLERNYRIKDLIYYIITSKSYARRSPNPKEDDKSNQVKYYLAERMDSDQLMNSLIRATTVLQDGESRPRKILPFHLSEEFGEPDLTGIGEIKFPKQGQTDIRSSFEVPRPADNHRFLRIFGSGARMDISDDEKVLSIEQVLNLVNGRLYDTTVYHFGDNDSFLKKEYERSKKIDSVFDLIFLSTLSRKMTGVEKKKMNSILKSKLVPKINYSRSLVHDVLWSVVNSQEFLHNN